MLGACQHATLCLELEEFLVSVDTCKDSGEVGIDEHRPSISHFTPLRIPFLIVTENVAEQAKSIATVVGAKILDLSFYKASKLVDDALKGLVVELVQDA